MPVRKRKLPTTIAAVEKALPAYAEKLLDSCRKCINDFDAMTAQMPNRPDTVNRLVATNLQYILGPDGKSLGRDSLATRLKNESALRVGSLFYMYICKMLGRDELTQCEFVLYKRLLEESVGNSDVPLSAEAKLLAFFGVPRQVLPNDYAVMLAQLDEFEKAVTVIVRAIDAIDPPDGLLPTYEAAKEYYCTEAAKLIDQLHAGEMYGTYSVELMALLIMTRRIGVVTNYPLYKVGSLVAQSNKDTEAEMIDRLEHCIKQSIKIIGAINETDDV